MKFDQKKLNDLETLCETTPIQEAYQEFIQLFRHLRIEMKKRMDNFTVSSHIEENNFDFAYFQLTNDVLKKQGCKLQIIFNYAQFQFEVWISGYNRKIQCAYYKALKDKKIKYILNDNPTRVDYIFKAQCSKDLNISDSEEVLANLNVLIEPMVQFLTEVGIK